MCASALRELPVDGPGEGRRPVKAHLWAIRRRPERRTSHWRGDWQTRLRMCVPVYSSIFFTPRRCPLRGLQYATRAGR